MRKKIFAIFSAMMPALALSVPQDLNSRQGWKKYDSLGNGATNPVPVRPRLTLEPEGEFKLICFDLTSTESRIGKYYGVRIEIHCGAQCRHIVH